jgi:predicted house-cleaning NTP pyrophosphatase (Maf/HAM1 superfamily)
MFLAACGTVIEPTLCGTWGPYLVKPADRGGSRLMLAFVGGWHYVYPAFLLKDADKTFCEYERTWVKFRSFAKKKSRVISGRKSLMDKAGAYGIQAMGPLE